ncbi:TIGR03936 family radical SAM-associated protein [Pseudonocardia acaciae]|uniref:TIGR03936 family radical SAM-associated protein n=1 Tax=Pseudonocardia acaciae TaxID=551276 RepID=UPI0006858294|nr:TIGR03936 family radical SAM-associated protein [Pseudonocardia acaciae]
MSARGTAPNPAPPTVCKVRVRFAKRGRLRFASHRDVARAFERAVRRARLPVARSHGFSPHPRLSWVGAAPTGTASEAEYVEIGLTEPLAPERLTEELDAALPTGLDVLDAVVSEPGAPALADLIDAGRWRIEVPGVAPSVLAAAVRELLAAETAVVRRATKNGPRPVDVRAALVSALVEEPDDLGREANGRSQDASGAPCAIMTAVVRQTRPAVRPDDVLGALQLVADLRPPVPPMAIRLAQGLLDDRGRLADPFDAARATTSTAPEGSGAEGDQHAAER